MKVGEWRVEGVSVLVMAFIRVCGAFAGFGGFGARVEVWVWGLRVT